MCVFYLLRLGRDFSHDETLDVPTQVELLIKQATSHENLCQCYIGWYVKKHKYMMTNIYFLLKRSDMSRLLYQNLIHGQNCVH